MSDGRGHTFGSMQVVWPDHTGNLTIRVSHTGPDRLRIQRADVPDLLKALVSALGTDYFIQHAAVYLQRTGEDDQIAEYVAGDGSDSLRVALADGIREGRYGAPVIGAIETDQERLDGE